MKRKQILLLFVIFCLPVMAQKRTTNELCQLAQNALTENHVATRQHRQRAAHANMDDEHIDEDQYSLSVLYDMEHLAVVGYADGGYAIISKDSDQKPLWGYSSSVFDCKNIAPNLNFLLECMNKQVVSTTNKVTHRRIVNAELPLEVQPLTKTKWDQGKPFNSFIPQMDNGQMSVTGCVATAWAQIVKYYRTPTHATGYKEYTYSMYEGESFEIKDRKISMTFDYYKWDFDNLKDNYYDEYTAYQCECVCNLMYVMGVICNAEYGYGFTRAYYNTPDIYKHLGYKIKEIENSTEIYKHYVAEGIPVFYAASELPNGNSASHAMIIDGYDKNGLLHINLGWGDSGGYYNLSNGVAGYKYYQTALIVETTSKANIDGVRYDYNVMTGTGSVGTLADGEEMTSKSKDVILKSAIEIDGKTYSIKELSDYVCYGNGDINTLTVSEGFKNISRWAFANCSKLKTIHLPRTISSIDNFAFYGTSPQHIYCESLEVPAIGEDCFSNVGNITLHVPFVALESYRTAERWKNFGRIIAIEDGDDEISTDKPQTTPIDRPEDVPTHLVIWKSDGSRTVYLLNEMPKTTVDADILHIAGQSFNAEYPMKTIEKFTFAKSDDIIVSIDAPSQKGVKSDNEALIFEASDKDLHVRIISTGGIVVKDFTVKSNEYTKLPLNVFTPGIYIIDINGLTSKIYCK